MSHTKGPWRAHDHNAMAQFGRDPKDWIGYAWVGQGGRSDGRFDAMVANLDRRKDRSKEYRERAAADARLIATAPEQHNLLTEALDLVPRMSEDDPIAPALAEWCQRVRTVVAKAKGSAS